MSSPLFRNFGRNRAYRAKAREVSRRLREAANSAGVGQVLPGGGVGGNATGGNGGGQLAPTWARSALNSLWDVMASAGQGPLGEVVQALMRPYGEALVSSERELAGAMNLVADLMDSTADGLADALRGRPQNETFNRSNAEREARNAADAPPPPEYGYRRTEPRGRGVFGHNAGYDENDPVMTGEMIRVSSSNVHSIGYRWNEENPSQGTLVVRFLEGESKKKTAAGPTYSYYNVHPQVFKAFQLAASKGKFVWDRLRIRGTVTGHQFDYRLIGTGASGYVPRQAKRYGRNEYFIGRSVQAANGQQMRSALPDRMVNRLSNRTINRLRGGESLPYRGQTGAPNRGQSGTPNRGR